MLLRVILCLSMITAGLCCGRRCRGQVTRLLELGRPHAGQTQCIVRQGMPPQCPSPPPLLSHHTPHKRRMHMHGCRWVYGVIAGYSKGLVAGYTKGLGWGWVLGGQGDGMVERSLNADKTYTTPTGDTVTLSGRSLLLVR